MRHFTIYNEAGDVLRMGTVPDEAFELQAQPGERIEEGHAHPIELTRSAPALSPPPFPYAAARKRAYPSIEQQLDWLWHAMDSGDMPKASPFYEQIAAVKSKFPKQIDTSADHGQTIDL